MNTSFAHASFTVLDVGGTTVRIADYDPGSGTLSRVHRMPVDGMNRDPSAPVHVLQQRVVDQLALQIKSHIGGGAGALPRAVGIAFAGPITSGGLVRSAPTVWGGDGRPLPLGTLLAERLGTPVTVVNDLTAAAWRYAATEVQPFCLITVSSGIGNKVFRGGEVLLDSDGHGGELGHWRYDTSPDAPLCDCGGRGHLGAIASGRGVLAATRKAAAADRSAFDASLLAVAADGRPEAISNEAIATAVRAGDPFSTAVLRGTLVPLAHAITSVFASIGIRRYILMGGFALAVGDRYRRLLVDELERLGCFGLDASSIDAMISLGVADDDHGLLGIGRLLAQQPVTREGQTD